jgi:hypothetical protein
VVSDVGQIFETVDRPPVRRVERLIRWCAHGDRAYVVMRGVDDILKLTRKLPAPRSIRYRRSTPRRFHPATSHTSRRQRRYDQAAPGCRCSRADSVLTITTASRVGRHINGALARIDAMTRYGIPDVAHIATAGNYPGAAMSTLTGTCRTTPRPPADGCPAHGTGGNGYRVGGRRFHRSKLAVREFPYSRVGEYGWGRVANRAAALTVVNKILITSPYLDWTSAGTPLSTPEVRTPPSWARTVAVAVENSRSEARRPSIDSDLYAFLRPLPRRDRRDPMRSRGTRPRRGTTSRITSTAARRHALHAERVAADTAATGSHSPHKPPDGRTAHHCTARWGWGVTDLINFWFGGDGETR